MDWQQRAERAEATLARVESLLRRWEDAQAEPPVEPNDHIVRVAASHAIRLVRKAIIGTPTPTPSGEKGSDA
jgi:hypothetical protein